MKRLVIAVLTGISMCGAAWSEDGRGDSAAVKSDISDVTVYADRAKVVRKANVALKGGLVTAVFDKLPGWVDEGSIRVAIVPADAGGIADVRVRREYLTKDADEEVRKARADVERISDIIAGMSDEIAVLEEEKNQVGAIRAFALEKMPKDAAVRDISTNSYGEVVAFVSGSLRGIAAARRDVIRRHRELQPELVAAQKRLDDLLARSKLEQTCVAVLISSAGDKHAELSLSYMLPGASWEPAHELRADGDSPEKVRLTSYATVTQTTGEDWNGVNISFSSQSSTDAIRIPELDSLLLGEGTAPAYRRQENNSFADAQARYAGQMAQWNSVVAKSPAVMQTAMQQNDLISRISSIFRGLADRGTTAHFVGTGRPTVRSDGAAVKVEIGSAELAATMKTVAAPEITLNAARTIALSNTAGRPLLPGRVTIYHNGAFMGMTDIDFVASGEQFSMFLGVADRIKLSRVLDRSKSKLDRGRRNRMKLAFDVTVENLAETPASLVLSERIPVSEDKDVRVEGVSIRPSAKPDNKGLMRWNVDLKPLEKQAIRIEYTIDYPPLVPRRSRAIPMPPDGAEAGVSRFRIEEYKVDYEDAEPSDQLYDKLESLEKAL